MNQFVRRESYEKRLAWSRERAGLWRGSFGRVRWYVRGHWRVRRQFGVDGGIQYETDEGRDYHGRVYQQY